MAANNVTKEQVNELYKRIQDLFVSDQVPWVIGYSGGKDSTATLQLVWQALAQLPPDVRNRKAVHVISTDTLVEQPIVAAWVNQSLELMKKAAASQSMPIHPHRLTPKLTDSYWVNLIGRGYPAPRQTFRWCTSRLKIEPSNHFILDMVKTHGEAIMVLGTRKAESSHRAANMERYERLRTRQWLSPNGSLPNSWVFTPIENWSNDDVWVYLMQYANPWGRSNKDLLTMYRGASADNECPLVVDTSTPSCGNSRFGCWVCTLVNADKSMEAMIQNDEEKLWMAPLLEFRNELGVLDENGKWKDRERRDFRRMGGGVKLNPHRGFKSTIPGPYTKKWREHFLQRLLEVDQQVRRLDPSQLGAIDLVREEELREIRRIWVVEKHEFDDSLPKIYEEVTGTTYPYLDDLEHQPFGKNEWDLLAEICEEKEELALELNVSLLDVEQRMRGFSARKSVVEELERVIKRCYYSDEADAVSFETTRIQLQKGEPQLVLPGFSELDSSDEGVDSE